MAECPRCGADVPEGGTCRACETARRARNLDLSVLRGAPPGPPTGRAWPAIRPPDADTSRAALSRFSRGVPERPRSRAARPAPPLRGAPPPPPPPTSSVGGSAEWWRERLRAAGISPSPTSAVRPYDRGRVASPSPATTTGPRDRGLVASAAPSASSSFPTATTTGLAPPGRPSPAASPPVVFRAAEIVAPAPPGRAVDVTPTPRTALDLGTHARRWRARHVVPIAVGALLLGAVILIWAPERTTDGELTRSGEAPAAAPPAPQSPAPRARSPRVGGGVAEASPEDSAEGPPAGAPGAEGCGPSGCPVDASSASQLLDEINQARARDGAQELAPDEELALVARTHVGEMVEGGRLFHTSNDVLGRRVTNWQILAESIGVGPSVASLMDAFLRSEVDRRNLLDPAFRHIGVAAIPQGQRLWVTVLFSDANDPGTTLSR